MNARGSAGLLSSVLLVVITACSDITKPNMPVVVTFRESLVGKGIVAQFYNQTNHQLTVYLVLENKEKNQRKKISINIPADDMVEVGWLEGWMFEPGETITVRHPNYRSMTWCVPDGTDE